MCAEGHRRDLPGLPVLLTVFVNVGNEREVGFLKTLADG